MIAICLDIERDREDMIELVHRMLTSVGLDGTCFSLADGIEEPVRVPARVDLAAVRAVLLSIAEECDRQCDEVGPAAHRAVLDGMICRIVIGVIDMRSTWPPSVGSEALPPRIKRALDDYAELGLRTGDCLYAVLTNDLRGAFARADPEVTAAMPAIVTYINSVLPNGCWGSVQAVESWIRRPRS